ncbi:sgt1-like protein [Plakobranchus ocellatus]|uniref:Sgt1-like protein n=1 Tax=Plakobranchus ocellatus TaxID=259542 RepID=A0AAV3ZZ39_9GAST|nr:sgt1-like protein [Plakobranchus ocellatus]
MANIENMKRIPDDVVEYSLFLDIPSDIEDDKIFDFLQKLADSIIAHFSTRLVNYIWQHESFHLRPVLSTNESIPPHLYGSTSFGDNIDDEWFIVSLLYEITKEFAGCVVRVNDNDEEFLLIEAADALPKWLNPETAENRVFVYNGDIHVIPIPESPEDYTKFPMFTPSLREAVACVRDCTSLTRCSQAVQNHIKKRLSSFPQKSEESIHHVNCYLPTPLAVLLDSYPSLVSAGVRRFYYRDPLELKACRPMKRFKPDDLIKARVKMTRCLYAQLVQQVFAPDRRSGWPIIAPSNPEFLEHDIGVKLAHGFEILCSKCKEEDNVSVDSENLDSSNIRWQQFKQSLASKGYFRGEIEGSTLYTKLLNEAKQFYLSQVSSTDDDVGDIGQLVLLRLKTLEPKFQEFRTSTQNLPPSDDDSWINVTPEQVDELMKSAGGLAAENQTQPFDLSKISQSMSRFVEHESGIDGAEFPKEAVENGDGDGQVVGSGMIEAMQKLFGWYNFIITKKDFEMLHL